MSDEIVLKIANGTGREEFGITGEIMDSTATGSQGFPLSFSVPLLEH